MVPIGIHWARSEESWTSITRPGPPWNVKLNCPSARVGDEGTIIGGGGVAERLTVRTAMAPAPLVAWSWKTNVSATSGVKVGLRIFAEERTAEELAGRRIRLHRQATAGWGFVSSWRCCPTSAMAWSMTA